MRLFLAINLPDEWKTLLQQPQEAIGWLGHGVRWVDPQGIHLTLKFLGDVDDEQLPVINDLLSKITANYSTIKLVISGTGVFPMVKRPRVFWAKVKAPDVLAELQSELESALTPLGFPVEDREFQPHLTLARIRDPIGKKRITGAFLKFKLSSDPFLVDRVSLIRSHLSREGAQYEEISAYPLAQSV
jgi:2'-5' RNA ligase